LDVLQEALEAKAKKAAQAKRAAEPPHVEDHPYEPPASTKHSCVLV
jgi:hypothetical protein